MELSVLKREIVAANCAGRFCAGGSGDSNGVSCSEDGMRGNAEV